MLVNNAGMYGDRDDPHPIFGASYEEWQRRWRQVLETNLTGAANVTWCAAQHMRERGGRIVNVSSRGAFRGEPDQPAYGASKAGLNALASPSPWRSRRTASRWPPSHPASWRPT